MGTSNVFEWADLMYFANQVLFGAYTVKDWVKLRHLHKLNTTFQEKQQHWGTLKKTLNVAIIQ